MTHTSALTPPTLPDVLAARKVVSRYLSPTPVLRPAALADMLGCDVALKCENLQPTGAFKVRGGINFMHNLDAETRARGVATASTGNHAQSIAYAAGLFGVQAVIYMPEVNNPDKVAATKRMGATVIEQGADFDECRVAAEEHAKREGMRYIHSANEPWLIAGVATYALELIEEEPELDVVIVPVGAGSGVCGTGIVFKTMRPETRIIGVQAEQMPAAYQAYRERRLVTLEGGTTWAEGLATRVAFDLPLQIMQERVDDMLLVSEEEMRQAMLTLMDKAHLVAEGAGSAALAAAIQMAGDVRGKRVGIVVSGGNVTMDTIKRAMYDDRPW
ncbi:threonine ammonia-lyase [soil metagenome]